MTRILSGIQPSGSLHIGNYFGMMKQMIKHQNSSELFCFIVNYHAMTSLHDGNELKKNTIEAAIDFLALGLDPDKSIFWIQSDVPEVMELSWILSCHTSLGLLERSHSYKDKISRGIVPNAGLFTYPVLMAADILLYDANIVPVGKDQKQHIEITRDIAGSFNNMYGDIFVMPEGEISEEISVIPGIDGQKMSKSYGNTINIFDDEQTLKKKVMKIVTDSTPVEDPKDPDSCNLFSIYKFFADDAMLSDMKERYLKGGTGYGQVKKELLEVLVEYFKPYRENRKQFENDHGAVYRILQNGADKARAVALVTLKRVKDAVGINY